MNVTRKEFMQRCVIGIGGLLSGAFISKPENVEAKLPPKVNINDKAILIMVSRRQLSNIPFANNQVHGKHEYFVETRIHLVDGKYTTNIRNLVSDALLLVWNNTRPWDNVGYRIMNKEFYPEFVQVFNKIKTEFDKEVKIFIKNYDKYVLEARESLGRYDFDESLYPLKKDLHKMFELKFTTSDEIDPEDFRLKLI